MSISKAATILIATGTMLWIAHSMLSALQAVIGG